MTLLSWALAFLLVSILAGAFGFGRASAASAGMARLLFKVFLVVFIVLLVVDLIS